MSVATRTAVTGAVLAMCCRAPAASANPSRDDTLDAAEGELKEPPSQEPPWNQVDLKLLTVRIGGGVLVDTATYVQDDASKEQLSLSPDTRLRDARILLKGRFFFMKDRLSYTLGYMYDAPDKAWHFRQTGVMLEIPELSGQLFVGRTKEGFSTNKLMVGYNGWTIERAAANEAFLPILADGIKWTGQLADNHAVYNAGWFIDTLSQSESFNKNDRQFAGRVVVLPFPKDSDTVLHLAGEVRFADANDGFLRYRSKPEVFLAQDFAVDTGKFAADHSITYGAEAYFRPGPLMFGGEYFWNKVSSAEAHDPLFQGGEVFGSLLITGEVHPYNTKGAFFEAVTPDHPLTSGGPGAWEVVLRYSRVDLDSGTIEGGKFWRVTPGVSWYLNQNIRLELSYGYSKLDRMGIEGTLQIVQARLQVALM